MFRNAYMLLFALLTSDITRAYQRPYHEYNNLHFPERQCPIIKIVWRKIPVGCMEECDFTPNCTAFNYKSQSPSQPEFCNLLACGPHPNYPVSQGSEVIGYSLKKIPVGHTNYNGPEKTHYARGQGNGCYLIPSQTYRHKTYVECEAFCEQTSLCTGYNFDLQSFDCWLVHCDDPFTLAGGDTAENWESWSKKSFIEGEYNDPNGKYYTSAQEGCYHIHPTYKGKSLDGCMERCDNEPYCIGFNLNHNNNLCELFYCKVHASIPTGDTEVGWQSYSKKYFGNAVSRIRLYIELEKAKAYPDSDKKCTELHLSSQNNDNCRLFCDIHKACTAYSFSSVISKCLLLTCRRVPPWFVFSENPPVPAFGFSERVVQTYIRQEVKEEGWTPLENACIKYYKYNKKTDVSIDICQEICEQQSNCRSISYDVSNNDCHFSELDQSAAQYTEPCYQEGFVYTERKLKKLDCEWGAVYVGGQCLRFSTGEEAGSWSDAAYACDSQNHQLATLKYPLTVLAYTKARFGNTQFWAGGSDSLQEGVWKWMTGERFFAFPWTGFDDGVNCRNQPDNDGGLQNCLVVNFNNGCFDDQVCDHNHKRYICEDLVETRTAEARNYHQYSELYFSKRQCRVISSLYVDYQESSPVRWCLGMCDNTPGCTEVNYNATGVKVDEDCFLFACGNDPPYPEGRNPGALSYSLKIITENYTHYEGPQDKYYSTDQGCVHIHPTLKSKSYGECDEACDSNSNCIGYNFNKDNYDCELFFCDHPDTSPEGSREEGWTSWRKKNFRRKNTQSYVIFPGSKGFIYDDRQCKNIKSYNDRRDILYDHRNWDYCKRRCDINKQCTAFNYHRENGCVLRDCGQYPPAPGKYPVSKEDGWQAFTLKKLIGCRDYQKNCQNNKHFCNTKIGRNECAFTCGLCGEDFKVWSPGMLWEYNKCPWIGETFHGTLEDCKNECILRGCTVFNFVPGAGSKCEILNCPLPVPKPTWNYGYGWFGYSRTTVRFSKYYGPYGPHFLLSRCTSIGYLNKTEATYVECERRCDQEPWCTGYNYDNYDKICDLVACHPRDLIPDEIYPPQVESWSKDIITDPEPKVRCPSYKCTLDNAVGLKKTCDGCRCNSNPYCYHKCQKCSNQAFTTPHPLWKVEPGRK